MTASIKKMLTHLPLVVGIFAFLLIGACTDSSDTKATTATIPGSTDTTSAKTDTATVQSATVKPKRKGKASTAMAADAAGTKIKIEKDKDGIYSRAETMPEYPGGSAALSKYVEDHISYPQDALDDSREGTVKVSFIIDEKGKVIDPMVSGASVTHSLDNEATRIVKQMPEWKPGTVKGKKVKTRLELPITFKLGDS